MFHDARIGLMSNPTEVVFPGTDFKMVFRDAKVEFGIADDGKSGLGLHFVAFTKHEPEFLLIDRRGGKYGCFHAIAEPLGHRAAHFSKVLNGLHLVLHALVGAVAQSNDTKEFFVVTHLVGVRLLAEHKSYPAGIQAKHLGADNDFLAVIAVARSVLPTSLKTEIVMTANLREWRHFFKLRAEGVTGAPHPQMLEVTVPLLIELKKLIPVVFDDINVEQEERR